VAQGHDEIPSLRPSNPSLSVYFGTTGNGLPGSVPPDGRGALFGCVTLGVSTTVPAIVSGFTGATFPATLSGIPVPSHWGTGVFRIDVSETVADVSGCAVITRALSHATEGPRSRVESVTAPLFPFRVLGGTAGTWARSGVAMRPPARPTTERRDRICMQTSVRGD
jgi:hypothetical protein